MTMPALRRIPVAVLATAAAAALGVAAPLASQLASRPADEWARTLDSPERLAGLRIDEVVAALGLKPGDVVADLGAGSGPFVVPFARAVGPTGRVYAADIDRGFFPYIEQKAQTAAVRNVQTVLSRPTDPALPATDVTLAFIHDVLHHVEDRPAYLKAVARYLAPGGRVAVIDYHAAQSPHRNEPALQVTKEETAAWMAAAGLKPVADLAFFTDKWFVVYGR